MGKEIEHKYLVISDSFKENALFSYDIIQGYLCKDKERVVRIRICDSKAYLTIKGETIGDSRLEFEYEIPLSDAENMLPLCVGNVINKTRWIVMFDGNKWEVDVFHNRNVPTLAEIELPSSDYPYKLPPFVGEEVTGNPAYYNSNL